MEVQYHGCSMAITHYGEQFYFYTNLERVFLKVNIYSALYKCQVSFSLCKMRLSEVSLMILTAGSLGRSG